MLSLFVILFAVLLGTDVVLKRWVEENIDQDEKRELFNGKIIIRKVYNRGFILNFLDHKPGIVKGMTVAATIGVFLYDTAVFLRRGKYARKLGLTLLSAGAASNTFDRLAKGKVTDYIGYSGKKFPARFTANFGDLYIAFGGILILICDFLKRR